jgi:anti-anti-sigma factor
MRRVEMEEQAGSIETETDGDVTVMSLVGEHDILNAEALRLRMSIATAAGGGLVVSLMRTEFFDSAILHALFRADRQLRQCDRRLVLHVATASIVRRVLDLSGLADTVACTASLEEAVALARSAPDRSK